MIPNLVKFSKRKMTKAKFIYGELTAMLDSLTHYPSALIPDMIDFPKIFYY